jgi:LemA protein
LVKITLVALCLVVACTSSSCGYNKIQQLDEETKSSWSEVLNQYQRRADLIPNLVNTVKGYAAHEEKVLTEVTEARAKVGSLNLQSDVPDDPTKLAQFQAAQADLSGALSRLLVIAENYPQLKADQGFRDLQAQLEGTENRITVARGNYIRSVNQFNSTIRSFPTLITAKIFGNQPKPQFTVENEAAVSKPPSVDFSK